MEEDLHSTLVYRSVYDDATAKQLSNDFSRLRNDYYLDHAGATLHSDTQIKNIVTDLHRSLYANPHSIGTASSLTQDTIERIRYRILDHFHVSPDEYGLIFTSGATASMKIIAETFVFNAKDKNDSVGHGRGHFVYTQDNHTSVLGMREVVAERGAAVNCLTHKTAFDIFNNSSSRPSLLCNENLQSGNSSNSLFVYPAQCNFSGLKYPLKWIQMAQNGVLSAVSEEPTQWYVLLDAAAFVPTNDLDLSVYKPDFVCLSFYKMFGYPTGIGALLVKNSSAKVLRKVYYGGGTVNVSLSSEMFHVKRETLHQRFEDGTVPFLSIISLAHGFDILSSISMNQISKHVFSLARYLHHHLLTMHHGNGEPVVKLYSDTDYEDSKLQGGTVTFNLIRADGDYIGYMEILSIASLFRIHLRTGCFCNPGACQRHLDLSNEEILKNYDDGYVCGGAADLINGKPTGAVRVSFGYMSTIRDVEMLLYMINKCFVQGVKMQRIPSWWCDSKSTLRKKYTGQNVDNTIHHMTNYIKSMGNEEVPMNESATRPGYTNLNSLMKSCEIGNNYIESNGKNIVLERLFIYPIKSCGAYEIKGAWNLNSRGLQYDREWMIMSSSGACLTQKQDTSLCLIKPVLCKEKKVMILGYPGMPTVNVPLENTSKNIIGQSICRSRVCGHKVEGVDCGSEVSEWLSLALGRPNLRLIRQASWENKKNDAQKPELSFSSQAQYLLLNKASVMWLANEVQDTEIQKDTILDRFRGNIVVSGCKAFEEAQWSEVSIGQNKFMVTGCCERCQMICIDQETGKKNVEPLRTLAKKFHGKLKFGIYLAGEFGKHSVITTGDIVKCK